MELSLMLAQADFWSQWLWPVLELVIGLGMVIFVHELGHFLVAKAVGIKVEKFSLGFGPRLCGLKRGETDYCISALPLGGYVKMLGQEDFKPLEDGQVDPRAYNNKPVWARLAVVSAGVVMNVVFGGILFIVVCLIGIQFPAAVIGTVSPGSPASKAAIVWDSPIPAGNAVYDPLTLPPPPIIATQPATGAASNPESGAEARRQTTAAVAPSTAAVASTSGPATVKESFGLMPGDEILSVDGKTVSRWQTVATRSVLAKPGQTFTLRVKRNIGDGQSVAGTASVGVRPDPLEGKRLEFGMGNAIDMSISIRDDLRVNSQFKEGDRIVAVEGQPVGDMAQLRDDVERLNVSPVTLTVERKSDSKKAAEQVKITLPLRLAFGKLYVLKDKETVPLDAAILAKSPLGLKVQYPDGRVEDISSDRIVYNKDPKNPTDNPLTILGMTPRVMVAGVIKDSPADQQKFQPGDIIVDYADLGRAPTFQQLQELNLQYAGKGAKVTLDRDGVQLPPVTVVPRKKDSQAIMGFAPVMDMTHMVVAGVEEGSPAAKAFVVGNEAGQPGVKSGDVIEAVNGQPVESWQQFFFQLETLMGKDVTMTVRRGDKRVDLSLGNLNRFMFDPLAYDKEILPAEIAPRMLNVTIHMNNPLKAIAWGAAETRDFTIDTYVSLQRLVTGDVPKEEIRGPLGIGSAAIVMGRIGIAHAIYFMAIISISLAVINFLPIPVVDGGHVLFLIIEKIKGKPVSIKVMNIAQLIGIILLLALFLLAMKNDILRWWQGKW